MMSNAERLLPGQKVRATHAYPERGVFCPAVTWVWEGTVEEVRPSHSGRLGCWIETHVVLRDVTERTEPEEPRWTKHRERMTLAGFQTGTRIEVIS